MRNDILAKNGQIKQLVDQDETLEVLFIHEAEHYAVARVNPKIRSYILDQQGYLYLGLKPHLVRDQFHLTMCFTCQKYGHKSNSTSCSGKLRCLYCARSNHKSKDCKVKKNHEEHVCANCYDIQALKNGSYGHTTTSNRCPLVLKETKLLMARTAGCANLDPFRYLGLPKPGNL